MPNIKLKCPNCGNEVILRNTGQKYFKHCKMWHYVEGKVLYESAKREKTGDGMLGFDDLLEKEGETGEEKDDFI